MGRRLRMTAELGDWLTELGDSDPATAAEVAAALVAVLIAAEPADLPTLDLPDAREAVDHAYQRQLEELQHLRRSVSEVATRRKRAELRINAERVAGADAARLAELERDLGAVRLSEAELTAQSQRMQQRIDAFRTAKESAKALYTAAEAELRITEAIGAAGGEPADRAKLRAQLQAAGERLRALRLGAVPEAAPGLLELRADPLGSDTRILLAVEPADTVTLLAVLEGGEAVSEHGADAVRLASDLLTEIRQDGWPADIKEVRFENPGTFLARFFPSADAAPAAGPQSLAET